MPAVGFETWYQKQCPTVFKIKNVASGGKRIRVFKYPLVNGGIRDLMDIPYVSEADIRHSLLKGELFIKIICKEIIVVDSNIDLLQFDPCHKKFLEDAGIEVGLEVETDVLSELPYLWKQEAQLIGAKNNANRSFMVPFGDKFLEGNFEDNDFHIIIQHNGRRLIQNCDFIILESGGVGTGYDIVQFISFVPNPRSEIIADYVIENPNI